MDQQFGAWLRAPLFIAWRKKVVSVPGFFARKKTGSSSHPTTTTLNQLPKEHQHDANPTLAKVTDVTLEK